MKKLTLAIFVFFYPLLAFSADWVLIGRTDNSGRELYVDTASIVRSNDVVSFWEMDNFSKKQRLFEEKPLLLYRSSKEKNSIDCHARTYSSEYIVAYAGNHGKGSTVGDYNFSGLQAPTPIVPDSIGEALMKFVCSR